MYNPGRGRNNAIVHALVHRLMRDTIAEYYRRWRQVASLVLEALSPLGGEEEERHFFVLSRGFVCNNAVEA